MDSLAYKMGGLIMRSFKFIGVNYDVHELRFIGYVGIIVIVFVIFRIIRVFILDDK